MANRSHLLRVNTVADQIELSKENVQPLKRGRDASRTALALGSSRQDNLEKERDWEAEIIAAEHGADPLKTWQSYVAWVQDAYPSNGQGKLVQVLERATRSLLQDPRYKNDERYVALWVAYADLLPDPGDVFKFLHANKVGEDVALLYMAWAWLAEHRGNFAFADKVYSRGIARRASPVDRLKGRYAQFQRRMYRKWIDTQGQVDGAQGKQAAVDTAEVERTYVQLIAGSLEALAAAAGGPDAVAIREPVVTSTDENGGPSRVALGRITSHAAARSHRPIMAAGTQEQDYAAPDEFAADAAGRSLGISRPALGASSAAPTAGTFHSSRRPPAAPAQLAGVGMAPPSVAQRPAGNAAISIYEDESAGAGNHDPLGQTAGMDTAWRELPSEAAMRKENTLAPSRWTETAPLPVHAGTRSVPSSAAGGSGSVLIWEDEENGDGDACSSAVQPLPLRHALAARTVITAGPESLFANPLSMHQKKEKAEAPVGKALHPPAAAMPPADVIATEIAKPVPSVPKVDAKPLQAQFAVRTTEPRLVAPTIPFPIIAPSASSLMSYEELRARAWLEARPAIAAEIEGAAVGIVAGVIKSVYDLSSASVAKEVEEDADSMALSTSGLASPKPSVGKVGPGLGQGPKQIIVTAPGSGGKGALVSAKRDASKAVIAVAKPVAPSIVKAKAQVRRQTFAASSPGLLRKYGYAAQQDSAEGDKGGIGTAGATAGPALPTPAPSSSRAHPSPDSDSDVDDASVTFGSVGSLGSNPLAAIGIARARAGDATARLSAIHRLFSVDGTLDESDDSLPKPVPEEDLSSIMPIRGAAYPTRSQQPTFTVFEDGNTAVMGGAWLDASGTIMGIGGGCMGLGLHPTRSPPANTGRDPFSAYEDEDEAEAASAATADVPKPRAALCALPLPVTAPIAVSMPNSSHQAKPIFTVRGSAGMASFSQAEDVTINTRLAREDINDLFADSPGPAARVLSRPAPRPAGREAAAAHPPLSMPSRALSFNIAADDETVAVEMHRPEVTVSRTDLPPRVVSTVSTGRAPPPDARRLSLAMGARRRDSMGAYGGGWGGKPLAGGRNASGIAAAAPLASRFTVYEDDEEEDNSSVRPLATVARHVTTSPLRAQAPAPAQAAFQVFEDDEQEDEGCPDENALGAVAQRQRAGSASSVLSTLSESGRPLFTAVPLSADPRASFAIWADNTAQDGGEVHTGRAAFPEYVRAAGQTR